MIELLTDPAAWIGFATLVVLEIVLGIDNLIFIAILSEKLPPHQRDKARLIGLSLALLMRLGLIAAIAWIITLTQPLFSVFGRGISGRDLILLLGGLFLLYKATTELHERLEGAVKHGSASTGYASFTVVVAQIVALDAVFSLDSVITAVGMVEHLPVMVAAVLVSVGVMMVSSKPLTRFVNAHPTVVVLCLSFLLMIGLSLTAEGLGFHMPKGYLYAAIGFSILIEFFNQLAQRNVIKRHAARPLRERTADAVMRLMGGQTQPAGSPAAAADATTGAVQSADAFAPEERSMVGGVLSLAQRTAESIMTPRASISWVDMDAGSEDIRRVLLESPHALFPVARGSLEQLAGVGRAKDLLADLLRDGRIQPASLRAPIHVAADTPVLKLIETVRGSRGQLLFVRDASGGLAGVLSATDILGAIAGEFPDEDEAIPTAT
jgi:predicted tellurium resistance membrane protein TerC/CBS domain-containing protein